ncbi:hypothetical protein K8I85_08900, partial [bacterium]|nr:hypothetical protein [bacterium]
EAEDAPSAPSAAAPPAEETPAENPAEAPVRAANGTNGHGKDTPAPRSMSPRAKRSEPPADFPVEKRRTPLVPERVGDDVLLFRCRTRGPCTRFVLKEAFD